jgi:dienelactone hydrolase
VHFGIIGTKPPSPAPTVFLFGKEIEATLVSPDYGEALTALGPQVLAVALDGPCHGFDQLDGEPLSLSCWSYRLDQGRNIMADVAGRAKAVLDFLIRESYTDPAKVAAFGSSRGGFMAMHFAAVDPRVGLIAAFSPVTELLLLQEFSGMKHPERARALNAVRLVGALYNRPLWIIIGDTDHRVGTANAIEFAERFIDEGEAHGLIPPIEMRIAPAEGHATPDGAYVEAAKWLLRIWGSGNGTSAIIR